MIDFIEITITSCNDYQKLKNNLPNYLIDNQMIDVLAKKIGTKCDTIVVEYPYYDKDYLSAYYSHYSKKFRSYEKKCARLHFENGDVYYGFITLRPTSGNTKFGRTYLSPKLLINHKAYLMLGTHTAHIYGQDMKFEAFPWKRQQTDISCCAHTAAWTVIRYFSNKYRGYPDATIGDLVDHVQNVCGRKIPTQGLTPAQVSDLLKDYGFSPLVIENNINDNSSFSKFAEDVFAYIESGLPMVGFISPFKHAVSLMGHGKVNYTMLDDEDFINEVIDKEANVISHSRLITSVYVMDDCAFPYSEVLYGLPKSESDVQYGLNQFSFVVVPLYSKMQLTYQDVYNRMVQWIKLRVMNWEKVNVCRIYMTSSNSLKKHAMESKSMCDDLKNILLRLSFPKFVWCVDLAGVDNFKKGLTSGRIIIDATSATWENEPWILRHDMATIQYKDYDESPDKKYTVQTSITPYDLYINNLDECN